MKLANMVVGLLWVVACGSKDSGSGGGTDKPAAAADDQTTLCETLKAEHIKMGATPRDVFMKNCLAAPKEVVQCGSRPYYEAHKGACDPVLKKNDAVYNEIR